MRIGGVVFEVVEVVMGKRDVVGLVLMGEGLLRNSLGLESLSLASTNLARPKAWAIEDGFRMAISLRISGIKPDIKQLRSASGDKP